MTQDETMCNDNIHNTACNMYKQTNTFSKVVLASEQICLVLSNSNLLLA